MLATEWFRWREIVCRVSNTSANWNKSRSVYTFVLIGLDAVNKALSHSNTFRLYFAIELVSSVFYPHREDVNNGPNSVREWINKQQKMAKYRASSELVAFFRARTFDILYQFKNKQHDTF